MPAYIIFLRETPVSKPEAYAAYKAGVEAASREITPRRLTDANSFEMLEGAPLDGAAVLEFASPDDARTWYFSPAYQAAAPLRRQATTCLAILINGVEPAGLVDPTPI